MVFLKLDFDFNLLIYPGKYLNGGDFAEMASMVKITPTTIILMASSIRKRMQKTKTLLERFSGTSISTVSRWT